MIGAVIRYLYRIANWERIPRVPRMLAAQHYDDVQRPERRVMARMGSRDPIGVKRALTRHRASDIDDLVARLAHHRARRNLARRIDVMAGRIVGGTAYDPHHTDMQAARRQMARARQNREIGERVRRAKQ